MWTVSDALFWGVRQKPQVGFQGPREQRGVAGHRVRRPCNIHRTRRPILSPAVQHLPGHLQPAAQLQRVPPKVHDDGRPAAQPGGSWKPAGCLRVAR